MKPTEQDLRDTYYRRVYGIADRAESFVRLSLHSDMRELEFRALLPLVDHQCGYHATYDLARQVLR